MKGSELAPWLGRTGINEEGEGGGGEMQDKSTGRSKGTMIEGEGHILEISDNPGLAGKEWKSWLQCRETLKCPGEG